MQEQLDVGNEKAIPLETTLSYTRLPIMVVHCVLCPARTPHNISLSDTPTPTMCWESLHAGICLC